MEDFHDSPEVHIGLAHGRAALDPIGFDEKEMAGPPDLEIELAGVGSGGGPEDVALDAQLFHDVLGLREVAGGVRGGCFDRAFVIGLVAIGPVFMKRPFWMVEEQAGERKEPKEKNQEQAGVEMQLAIPALEAIAKARAIF